MTIKLLGTGDTTAATALHANYIAYIEFTCAVGGYCDTIKIYPVANANVRVGIYSTSSGKPSAKLAESNSTAVASGAWRSVPLIASYKLVYGTVYWLAVLANKSGGESYTYPVSSANYCYESYAYAALPALASGGSVYNLYYFPFQGWGFQGFSAPVCFDHAVV